MGILHTPESRRCRTRGFTLVEILVVVTVMAVLAAALVLSVRGSGERELAEAVAALQARLALACESAELRGEDIGLLLQPEGYRFLYPALEGWQPFARDEALRPHNWPSGVRVSAWRGERELALAGAADAAPQALCLAGGGLLPFRLQLERGEPAVQYQLVASDDGRVEAGPVP